MQYSKNHTWADIKDGIARIGITEYAQKQLKDIMFIELPEPGTKVLADKKAASIESVKTLSEVLSPVTGEVVEKNKEVEDDPSKINEDCYAAWLLKIRVEEEPELMTEDEYRKYEA